MRIRKTLWTNDAEPVIVIMVLLLVLGTLNVFSSSFVMATIDYDNPYYFLTRHLIMLVVGLGAFAFCRKFNYMRWRYLMPGMVVFIIVALVAVLIVGTEVNGARRWLYAGGVGFQPAEFAKLISLLLMAAYLSSKLKAGRAPSVLNLQAGIILLMAALTELEPDMGTALIIIGVPFIMLVVAGVSMSQLLPLISVGVTGAIGLIFLQPYRLERIKVMFDPWADAQGKGYQTVQSLSTIGSGGFWGMGLGSGVSKYDYLPEAHTDFAFAILGQQVRLPARGAHGLCFCHFLPGTRLFGSHADILPVGGAAALLREDCQPRLRRVRPDAGPGHHAPDFRSGHCQRGHGRRPPARGRRAPAFHQLRRLVPHSHHVRHGDSLECL